MLKITVLIENSAPGHLICEHGLSLHLNYDNHSYLLDTGTSGILSKTHVSLALIWSKYPPPSSLTAMTIMRVVFLPFLPATIMPKSMRDLRQSQFISKTYASLLRRLPG